METSSHRDREVARARRVLPAALYNQAHALLAHSPHGGLFIPLRPLQYLAVIGPDEILFVAVQHDDRVDLVWELPRPQSRLDLGADVPCEELVYHSDALKYLDRLEGELHLALREEAWRQRPETPALVLRFERR